MRRTVPALLSCIFIAVLFTVSSPFRDDPLHPPGVDPVNGVIGENAFLARYGRFPQASTDDRLRVRTHLAFMVDLLEARDVHDWPAGRRHARQLNIERLKTYVEAGEFPRAFDGPGGRIPCFIDDEGRLCAVGYLVAESAGRSEAERIDRAWRFARISEMEDPRLEAWVAGSGLTLQEVAAIQPTYGPPDPVPAPKDNSELYRVIEVTQLGLGTVFGGLNLDRALTNRPDRAVAIVGIAAGAANLLYATTDKSSWPVLDSLVGGLSIASALFSLKGTRPAETESMSPRTSDGPTGRAGIHWPSLRLTLLPGRSREHAAFRLTWIF